MKKSMLFLVALVVSCGGPALEADKEGCEHIKDGPSAPVNAGVSSGTATIVRDDHKRYDVAFVDVSGGKGGYVKFAAEEEGEFIVYLSRDVNLKVTDSADAVVAPKATAKSIAECTEVKARYTFSLKAGTHILSLGPTTETKVGLVIEHADH